MTCGFVQRIGGRKQGVPQVPGGFFHQAPMEQTVLKLASFEAKSISRGRLH